MMDALAAAMGKKTLNLLIGLRFEFAQDRRPDQAFTPHLAINAMPDIKMPENISGIFYYTTKLTLYFVNIYHFINN